MLRENGKLSWEKEEKLRGKSPFSTQAIDHKIKACNVTCKKANRYNASRVMFEKRCKVFCDIFEIDFGI